MRMKTVLIIMVLLIVGMAQTVSATSLHAPSGKVVHYDLYTTDGYVNTGSGVWPPVNDATLIAGWTAPLYVWGFTDIDPNLPGNLMTVPAGALAPAGGPVGNSKFPAPFLEVAEGDDVFITVHNRGFFQINQQVQDDHSLHLHGIHTQAQYDGFPESAGNFTERMRYFWQESWYTSLGKTTKARDDAFNKMSVAGQQANLTNPKISPIIRSNKLNPAGGIISQKNLAPYPLGVGSNIPAGSTVEHLTQFTYYFRAEHPGTYMYHCHVAASEHVQMGMYGALIIRPRNGGGTGSTVIKNRVYGTEALAAVGCNDGTGIRDGFDREYTFIISEIDPNWHTVIESGAAEPFYPPNWNPELWFVNGRTFPTTVLSFAWNTPTGTEKESRYNTYIRVNAGQKFLVRWINMGYQEHPMHQHGWHMAIIGSDARPYVSPVQKYTLLIGSGETYDTITTADPTYGADGNPVQGSRLGTNAVASGQGPTRNFRQIFPIHDHDDYRVTTNGIYPGGAVILMEGFNGNGARLPGSLLSTPTFLNVYVNQVQAVPQPPV